MERAPVGTLALMPAGAGIMIPKSVYDNILKRLVAFNEKRLSERNPKLVNHEKSAREIRDVQVLRFLA